MSRDISVTGKISVPVISIMWHFSPVTFWSRVIMDKFLCLVMSDLGHSSTLMFRSRNNFSTGIL